MSKLNSENYVKKYRLLYRLMYWFVLGIGVSMQFIKNVKIDNSPYVSAYFLTILFCYIGTEMLSILNYFDSIKVFYVFKYFELLAYGFFLASIPAEILIITAGFFLFIVLSVDFIIYNSDYDNTTIRVRELFVLFVMIMDYGILLAKKNERLYAICFFVNALICIVIYFFVEWLKGQNDSFDREKTELLIKLGSADETNNRLMEVHERIKVVNEQVNLQKIDLLRANQEMEEINRDTSAQADVLKFIVSTFDIQKCIDVMTESIVDVRKAGFCAVYIQPNVYSNPDATIVICSDYSTMERRLKKEISAIYDSFIQENKTPVVYSEDELLDYKFIGDVNIKTMAIFPLMDKNVKYGIMMVGSSEQQYFSRGVSKFESDVVGLSLAIKNTNMYLDMQYMARHDGLTGLYNRVYFTELFASTCKKASRKKTPFSIALFDIDHFKNVNDTYGHLAGDKVLIEVAKVAEQVADKYRGYCCRFGGEEFLVVLPEYEVDDALKVFEELHELIKAIRIDFNDNEISVDACIGLTAYPSICDDTKVIISRADKAMYYGKKHGRGRLIVDNKNIEDMT